jgi:hypothetical protein
VAGWSHGRCRSTSHARAPRSNSKAILDS